MWLRGSDIGSDLWGTPGDMVEPGEDPHVAGTRELREEIGLAVDPDALGS